MVKKILFLICLLNLVTLNAQTIATGNAKEDLYSTIGLFLKGSYGQFSETSNIGYGVAGVGASWYSFEHDQRLSDNARAKRLPSHIDFVGDLGIALNFAILHIGLYYIGQKNNDTKLMQFSMEYMAAMYLTLAETGLLSYISVHERPNQSDLSKWETEFRGSSSWPSGHIVPYAALFFKTLQFYGPAWSTIPAVLTLWSSMQRVREGRHYMSDVVSAFFLTALASEGVRAAANYESNHPFYKWVFEHEAKVGVLKFRDAIGPKLVFTY